MKNRIYADFSKLDDEGLLILSCRQSAADLLAMKEELHDGASVIFYMDDEIVDGIEYELETDGVLVRDEGRQQWLGRYDNRVFRHGIPRPIDSPQ